MRARRHVHIIIGVLLGGLLLSGCKPDEPTQQMAMPISICLPAGEIYTSMRAPELRAFGDPGTTEQFALPQYLYIYIVKYSGSGEKTDPTKWKVWQVIERNPTTLQWEKKHYTGAYSNVGDSIFQYTEEIILLLGENGFDGRVYAVASAVALTLPTMYPESSTLADVLGMQFSFNGENATYNESVRTNLQNIYSTPHNYNGIGSAYYGSFYASQNVPHLDLLLYHVAAKMDLMWNVSDIQVDTEDADDEPDTDLRSLVKLSYIAAEHLYDGPCYLFKPTENTIGDNELYSSGYTKTLINEAPPCPGTQWNGRAYFYAIPYKNNDVDGESNPDPHYPLQLRLQKGGDDPTGASYYRSIVKTDIPNVWTSWIRGQITINTADYNVP